MRFHQIFFLIFTLNILLSCSKAEDSSKATQTNSAKNITTNDFDTTSYDNLTKSGYSETIYWKINGNSVFKNQFKIYETPSTDDYDCLSEKFKNITFEKDGVQNYKLIINDTSLKDCFSSDNTTINGTSIFSAAYEKIKVIDSSGYYINLLGKRLSEINNYYIVEYLIRIFGFQDINYIINNQNYEYVSLSKMYRSSESNDTCKVNNDFMFLNKCFNRDRYIYKLHIDNELSESMNYLEIYKFLPGLSGSKKGTYYKNGVIDFILHNWSGTMTYGSDSNEAPTYFAANGIDNVTGVFDSYENNINLKVKPIKGINLTKLIYKILERLKKQIPHLYL